MTAQSIAALERANDIRMKRSRLKRALKAGDASIIRLLMDPPEYIEAAKVADLLRSIPWVGEGRAADMLRHCGIPLGMTVGQLALRPSRRDELVVLLRRYDHAAAG